MTKVDFYQIDSDEPALLFTCRLLEKVYRKGHQIYVHTASEGQSSELDELLWSFRADRFIPHAIQTKGLPPHTEQAPIKIGHNHEPEEHQDVLINLSNAVPDFFSRFDRVAEIVPLGEENRNFARENYRFYKERGYNLQYHTMNNTKQGTKS